MRPELVEGSFVDAHKPFDRLWANGNARSGRTECWATRDNQTVKQARPPLVQGLERAHWRKVRTAQGSAAVNGCPPRGEDQSNRDESMFGASRALGETGNLCAQQHQIGQHECGRFGGGVRSAAPHSLAGRWHRAGQRCPAQRNGGHVEAFARGLGCTESGLSACFTLFKQHLHL